MTQMAAREQLSAEQQATWKTTLIEDDRRRRPLYFDGRFLTANDLVREQDYFLTRQADLGRAGGGGIARGLHVTLGDDDTHLRISEGHGVTSLGEACVIGEPLTIDVTDASAMQHLDATFGLLEIPREPTRNLSGIYLLALPPVEFSATPIAAYPTSVNGTRKQHDGEIIEGVVATLIAHKTVSAPSEQHLQRSIVAREMFVDGKGETAPPGTLPLAIVAIEQNRILWIDSFLVRRELGTERSDLLGLGTSSRAAREASIQQYNRQLDELIAEHPGPITATTFFAALPPAGRMPTASVSAELTQVFFPPEMEVDLTLIPADELPQLIEESLALPPIDLTLNAGQLQSTSVTVFVPVPRESYRTQATRLESVQRTMKSAAPGLVAKRSPFEQLLALKAPAGLTNGAAEAASGASTNDDTLQVAAWRELLSSATSLWYARRHNVPWQISMGEIHRPTDGGDQPTEPTPEPGEPTPEPDAPSLPIIEIPEGTPPAQAMLVVFEHFESVQPGIASDAKKLILDSTDGGFRLTEGASELLVQVLGSPRFVAAPSLVLEAYFLLRAKAEQVERMDKVAMAEFLESRRYTSPAIGTGLRLLQRTTDEFRRLIFHLLLAEADAASIVDQSASAIAAESRERLIVYGENMAKAIRRADAQIAAGGTRKKVLIELKTLVNSI